MTDTKLLADLGHGVKDHDGEVYPHLVPLSVGQLDGEEAVNRDKLKLVVRHDAVTVEGLPGFVQPHPLLRPPQAIV